MIDSAHNNNLRGILKFASLSRILPHLQYCTGEYDQNDPYIDVMIVQRLTAVADSNNPYAVLQGTQGQRKTGNTRKIALKNTCGKNTYNSTV